LVINQSGVVSYLGSILKSGMGVKQER